MNTLKNADWSKVNEAYQLFITTGQLLPNAIRPQVARSWQRSHSLGVDPWTPRPDPISDAEFIDIAEVNREFLELATPVMHYMYGTNNKDYVDNLVQITDKTGVVLDFFTRISVLPNPRKKRLTENHIGTGLTGIVLAEQIPVEVGGPEYYKVCYQTCFGGAAPVKDSNGKLIGILSLYNNYGKIPQQPLEFVETAARLIENLLECKNDGKTISLESNPYFTKMLNCVTEYAVVVDQQGYIINFNDKLCDLLNLPRERLIGRACQDFGIHLNQLISDENYANKDSFSLRGDTNSYCCLLQNNKTVKSFNDQENTLLLFSLMESMKCCARFVQKQASIESMSQIIGRSSVHDKLTSFAKRAAVVPSNVLIEGESGTGKEVMARYIHNASPRVDKPFIAINCGAIPKDLLQSELFGYEEGAFTGGKKGGKNGCFEAADKGTLLLDEIGDMPLEMQVSLLRFLQDKIVVRVGSQSGKKVDVRIIAATNRDLKSRVNEGLFRQDLYYRLRVINITLPPLRSRRDDILPIAEYYLSHYAGLYGLENMFLTQETKNRLYQYNWPGNVRELANVMERVVVFSDDKEITPDLLPTEILQSQLEIPGISSSRLEDKERELIVNALYVARGNVSKAAKSIGISRNTLYRKIDKYGIQQ